MPEQQPEEQALPREELRFAVVLNGGVSLAIWMGGAVAELDRLVHGEGLYGELLTWAQSTARVDVISGTSAGGINGAALALTQCNQAAGRHGVGMLRDLWVTKGSFAAMLRPPFHGSPRSLLNGDAYFLEQLNGALRALAEPYEARPVDEQPMDLTITATLLRGVPTVTWDSAGRPVGQTRHDGQFRFSRGPTQERDVDDFDAAHLTGGALTALALAARSTASFPLAFEASYVPSSGSPDRTAQTDERHPDMSAYLAGAWDRSDMRSRFVVDGGLLANTPTRPALQAVDAMPADGLVRRVMLLVHPHAPEPETDVEDRPSGTPSVLGVGGSILGAMQSEGGRNYADLIGEHNRVASGRRLMRGEVLAETPDHRDLHARARAVYPLYRRLRVRRTTRDLTEMWLSESPHRGTRYEGTRDMVFDDIFAVLDAAGSWLPRTAVPEDAPVASLGFEAALGVVDAAIDYLRRAMWEVSCRPAGDAGPSGRRDRIVAARRVVSQRRTALVAGQRALVAEARRTAAAGADPAAWALAVLAGLETPESRELLAASVSEVCSAVARTLPADSVTPLGESGPDAQDAVLTDFATLLGDAPDADEVRRRLLDLHVLTHVVGDEVVSGNALPLDLVHMTYQVEHPFAPGLSGANTGERKVAGDLLNRFGAFLRASWRMNDWIWGRLDASQTLCQTVLEPTRVRRYLAGEGGEPTDVQAAVTRLYAIVDPEDALTEALPTPDRVVAELAALLDGSNAPLRNLSQVFATGLAIEIAVAELPHLATAVAADLDTGANPASPDVTFVRENEVLLTRLTESPTVADGYEALVEFAAAGIGSAGIAAEMGGAKVRRTAATAAATAVTVVGGDGLGTRRLRRVRRSLRSAGHAAWWGYLAYEAFRSKRQN